MLPRRIESELRGLLAEYPAVALLGPRQAGKTTLALEVAKTVDSVYLDLESYADRARLTDAELYLSDHEDRLVVLDEVHRAPDLFRSLRGLIDSGRRSGRFLLLGSASMESLRQSGESLAGRVAYLELGPLDALEVDRGDQDLLWTWGGFPDSYLADDDGRSLRWRDNFIRTYLSGTSLNWARAFPQRPSDGSGRCWPTRRVERSISRPSREAWE